MRTLVTGASGFLGRAVVQALLARGHVVRTLVRPSTQVQALGWPAEVEIFRGDLRVHRDLTPAFDNIDVLVHLAGVVVGDDAAHFATTIGGTERLLEAMSRSRTHRIILASSLSVYDWRGGSTLDETTPEAPKLYEAGAYAIAKTWQERLSRRMSRAHGWDLTVLRPGVIWGPGRVNLPIVGPTVGSLQVIIGLGRRLPLTYVENCADAFVRAMEDPKAAGEVFNIVDDEGTPAWSFAGEILKSTGTAGRRFVVPYAAFWISAMAATAVSRLMFKGRGKLPSLLMPSRLAFFRPMRFSNRKLRDQLAWRPPWTFAQALGRTFRLKQEASVPNAAGQQ